MLYNLIFNLAHLKVCVGAFSKCDSVFFSSAVCSLPTEVSLCLKQFDIFCCVTQFTK